MKPKSPRTFLIVTTIVFGLAGVIGILPALTSFFLFDALGSTENPGTIVLFISALSFPIVCALSIAASWTLYAMKRFTVARWLAFLPVLNLLLGGAALAWLQIFNAGLLS